MINIIACVDEDGGLGFGNSLLYRIPNDLKRFKKLTTAHYTVMGRNTWESLPKPLPARTNVILTKDKKFKVDEELHKQHDIVIKDDLHRIINHYNTGDQTKELFVIGGASIYSQAFSYADKVYLTLVHDSNKKSDVYFPMMELDNFEIESEEKFYCEKNKVEYSFINYVRKENGYGEG